MLTARCPGILANAVPKLINLRSVCCTSNNNIGLLLQALMPARRRLQELSVK
jgi:hypothetical protein